MAIDLESDVQLAYDIQEENMLSLDFRLKKVPAPLKSAMLRKTRDQLNLPAGETKGHPGLMFEIDEPKGDFVRNYFLLKRISYLAGPRTAYALDIDIRSVGGVKFYGLRPTVSHQVDKLTMVKFGFSAMPGTTAILLGASREIAKDV